MLGAFKPGASIEVVSLGTGSKCIGPKRMDKDGKLLISMTNLVWHSPRV